MKAKDLINELKQTPGDTLIDGPQGELLIWSTGNGFRATLAHNGFVTVDKEFESCVELVRWLLGIPTVTENLARQLAEMEGE